jgi:transposase
MKKPLPPIAETPEARQQLLRMAEEVRKSQRVQALYLLQTRQARTRHQVARLLGVSRHTVGRWLAAYTRGGVAPLLTLAKAPGKAPLVSPAIREALSQRLAQPGGFGSYKAIWQWLQQDCGLALAYTTAHRLGRYHLRAKLKVPRQAPIKNP